MAEEWLNKNWAYQAFWSDFNQQHYVYFVLASEKQTPLTKAISQTHCSSQSIFLKLFGLLQSW